MTMSHIVTRIGWAAGGLALASATVFGTAGSATADSPILTIQGSPMPVQVGGTYWVVDDVLNPSGETFTGSSSPFTSANKIWLYDNGECVTYDILGANGTGLKSMRWIPTTAGTHTLQVRMGSSAKTLTVTVEPAPPGTAIPAQTSCGTNAPTGSFGA
ncbi:hypothetical protein [Nocardia tengchongensis]|uniref:Ig-like domain-containing protein n=1 Tax=Nocardia tengchongensis TaxID=2055889 RepID=A0ABX8CK41_9NOCA|nr:hypothetical protein [Nocardia tengchongensis]QVI19681.1 hypothetical protein KHQ06_25410 [Nocardia tengchongensis]